MENNKMIIYDNPDTGTIIESVLLYEWNDFNEKHYLVESPLYVFTRGCNDKQEWEIYFLVSDTIKKIEHPNLVIKGCCVPIYNTMDEDVEDLHLDTFMNAPEAYLRVYYKFNIREDYIKWKLSN